MERSEPSLVPEWLKNAGSSVGGSSQSHSDDHAASRVARNKSSVNGSGPDFGHSSSSERTTSSYFRRSSSSNNSGNFRSRSSIGGNQHDREWEKELYDSQDHDKSAFGDRRHRDFSDPLRNPSKSKFERDGLRRSQSMISGKNGSPWPNKAVTDSGSAAKRNANGHVMKGSPGGGANKSTFEKDFPSLGPEGRVSLPEIGRVPSPGPSTAIQNLPVGTSPLLGSEKWTSALAEVPTSFGANGAALAPVQQSTPSSSMSVTVGSTTGLNMAEAVAHGPTRAQIATQLSVGIQRLEELAIKQSRQLIPVKPTLPKTLVSNSSDKQKSKVGQPQHPVSPLPANYSPRGGPAKVDASKAANVGKLQVLKPGREKNGVIPSVKDNVIPSASKVVSPTLAVPPSVSGPAANRGPLNNAVPDRKPSLTVLDKRPMTQAQSRNDFFNLVRKKSMANSMSATDSASDSPSTNSTSGMDDCTAISSSFSDNKHAETEDVPATSIPEAVDLPLHLEPSMDQVPAEKAALTCNGGACDVQKYVSNGKKHLTTDSIFSEEEETAFLRSLGWQENDDEECLTEEEISAFYRNLTKYINSNPSSLRTLTRVQSNSMFPHIAGIDGVPSGLSSSDAKLES